MLLDRKSERNVTILCVDKFLPFRNYTNVLRNVSPYLKVHSINKMNAL